MSSPHNRERYLISDPEVKQSNPQRLKPRCAAALRAAVQRGGGGCGGVTLGPAENFHKPAACHSTLIESRHYSAFSRTPVSKNHDNKSSQSSRQHQRNKTVIIIIDKPPPGAKPWQTSLRKAGKTTTLRTRSLFETCNRTARTLRRKRIEPMNPTLNPKP